MVIVISGVDIATENRSNSIDLHDDSRVASVLRFLFSNYSSIIWLNCFENIVITLYWLWKRICKQCQVKCNAANCQIIYNALFVVKHYETGRFIFLYIFMIMLNLLMWCTVGCVHFIISRLPVLQLTMVGWVTYEFGFVPVTPHKKGHYGNMDSHLRWVCKTAKEIITDHGSMSCICFSEIFFITMDLMCVMFLNSGGRKRKHIGR